MNWAKNWSINDANIKFFSQTFFSQKMLRISCNFSRRALCSIACFKWCIDPPTEKHILTYCQKVLIDCLFSVVFLYICCFQFISRFLYQWLNNHRLYFYSKPEVSLKPIFELVFLFFECFCLHVLQRDSKKLCRILERSQEVQLIQKMIQKMLIVSRNKEY